MKIAVVGAVGVPARYGGFETLAEQLAVGTAPDRVQLVIYCQKSAYPEVELAAVPFAGHRRVAVPLRANGAGSMVHDAWAMAHAVFFERVAVLLVLGYSGAWALPFVRLLQPGIRIITNIDGMEWRRDKFGPFARQILRGLEWFATRFSHQIIADNAALVDLARELHGVDPVLIAYGGDHTLVAAKPSTIPAGYFLSVARIEPENNCHLILDACARRGTRLVFVGNWNASEYGRSLKAKYVGVAHLTLSDPVYEQAELAGLRAGAIGYLHGHSVGGTNPSLVEALFHTDRIFAFDCLFNRATLAGSGHYFADAADLADQIVDANAGFIAANALHDLRERYKWAHIVESYLALCSPCDCASIKLNPGR